MRKWIADKLVWLARKIDKPNVEAMNFMEDRMVDLMLTGQSFVKVTRIDPRDAAGGVSTGEKK